MIPTFDAAAVLRPTLEALVPGAVSGLVRQVIVSDGGSTDPTVAVAEAAGADVVAGQRGRGAQLARGAEAARAPWLLFLHADTVLAPGWEDETRRFIREAGEGCAGSYRFRLDDKRWRARILERIVAVRTRLFGLPYGDQGLLISRTLYREVGGYRAMPLMEDVDLVRRIGRRRLTMLAHDAITSAARYRREGYLKRTSRNAACLTLWYAGMTPERLMKFYEHERLGEAAATHQGLIGKNRR